jgi:hypothetical protein
MPLETDPANTTLDKSPANPLATSGPTNPYVDFYFEPLQTDPQEGDLIIFTYTKRLYYEIHDRTPLVLILNSAKAGKGYQPGRFIRGINLHYLTYGLMGQVIEMSHKGTAKSYEQLRAYQMCVNSFRHYLWNWIAPGSIKKMNIIAVQAEVNTIKQYGRMNQEDLRNLVKQQLEQKTTQPKAAQITKPMPATKPMPTIPTTPAIGASPEGFALDNNTEPAMPINQ